MKNDIHKVSVIIPVYKVEKELDRCIQSVMQQTYQNLEIILVDDGSPDQCPQMCDTYQKKDTRIKVIHKKNGGLSSARNAALDIASGEYIAFVDSDDWIALDFIETLVHNAEKENADISIIGFRMVWDDGRERCYGNDEEYYVYHTEEAIRELLIQRRFFCMVCQKLYKRSVFSAVRFPEGKPYEDVAISLPTFLRAKIVVFSGKQKYFYFQRAESIANSMFDPQTLFYLECCQEIIRFSDMHSGIYDQEAHTFYLRALLLFVFKLYKSPNHKELCKKLRKEIAKQKRYIWTNPFLELRKKVVLYMILIRFPEKILLILWERHSRG